MLGPHAAGLPDAHGPGGRVRGHLRCVSWGRVACGGRAAADRRRQEPAARHTSHIHIQPPFVADFDKAQEIYRLVKASPVRDLRTKAKALDLGAQAMRKLNLGSKSNVNPRNVAFGAYIPSQLEG